MHIEFSIDEYNTLILGQNFLNEICQQLNEGKVSKIINTTDRFIIEMNPPLGEAFETILGMVRKRKEEMPK